MLRGKERSFLASEVPLVFSLLYQNHKQAHGR